MTCPHNSIIAISCEYDEALAVRAGWRSRAAALGSTKPLTPKCSNPVFNVNNIDSSVVQANAGRVLNAKDLFRALRANF